MVNDLINIEQFNTEFKDIVFDYEKLDGEAINLLPYISKRLIFFKDNSNFVQYIKNIYNSDSKANKYLIKLYTIAKGEIVYSHNAHDYRSFMLDKIPYVRVTKYVKSFYLDKLNLSNPKFNINEERGFRIRRHFQSNNHHTQTFHKQFEVMRIKPQLISFMEHPNCDFNEDIVMNVSKCHIYTKSQFIIDLKRLFESTSNVNSEEELIKNRIKRYSQTSNFEYSKYLNKDYEEKKKEFMKKWGITDD